MPVENKSSQYLKLDECIHVEKPLLDQLDGFGWEVIDLDSKQHAAIAFAGNILTCRQNFIYYVT
jgi:transketolase N-terminal domain/subunit